MGARIDDLRRESEREREREDHNTNWKKSIKLRGCQETVRTSSRNKKCKQNQIKTS